MKGRSTLILLASIVVLGAFIVIQESMISRNYDKHISDIRLFSLDPDSLESMEFKLTNTVIRVFQEDGVWLAGSADTGMGRADVALFRKMISRLTSIGKGTTITEKHREIRGLDLKEYGFDQPTAEIIAVDNEGTHHWVIGRRVPLGEMVYVKMADGDEIYTVSDQLLALIPGGPEHLRDRVLFPGEAASVRRVEVRGSSGFLQMVKDPDSGWRIQQPIAVPADEGEVEDFVEKLYLLRIETFIAENVSDFSIYGLQGESRQISIEGSDGTSRMLVVGDDVPDSPGFVYVRRADDTSVFTIGADILPFFNMTAKRFRDARVVDIPIQDITSISIRHEAEQLHMSLDTNTGWRVTSPVVWDADPFTVTVLAKAWSEAVVTEFNVTNQTVATPEWTLEFGSYLSGTTNRIEVFPTSGKKDGLLIRRSGGSEIYQINLQSIPDTMIDPLAYKDRKIWELDQEGISKISIQRAGEAALVVERQENRAFALAQTNANIQVNAVMLGKLLTQLATVQARDYISYNPQDLEIYGLSNPAVEVHIGLEATNELGRVLLIGHETADGYYSMVKGRDVVFYLSKPVVNHFLSDLVIETKAQATVPE